MNPWNQLDKELSEQGMTLKLHYHAYQFRVDIKRAGHCIHSLKSEQLAPLFDNLFKYFSIKQQVLENHLLPLDTCLMRGFHLEYTPSYQAMQIWFLKLTLTRSQVKIYKVNHNGILMNYSRANVRDVLVRTASLKVPVPM